MLVCILGKSCSGKDSTCNALGYPSLPLFTTRPKRVNELDTSYFFCDSDGYFNIGECKFKLSKQNILEYRKYITVYGVWYYGTLKHQIIDVNGLTHTLYDLSSGIYCVPTSISQLHVYINNIDCDNIAVIYLNANRKVLLDRAIKRDGCTGLNIIEINRRLASDEGEYSRVELNFIKTTVRNFYSIRISKNTTLQYVCDMVNDILKYKIILEHHSKNYDKKECGNGTKNDICCSN